MNYICDVCAWIYEEAAGAEDSGIGPGTKWEDVPEDFLCPLCAVGKDQFSKYDQTGGYSVYEYSRKLSHKYARNG